MTQVASGGDAGSRRVRELADEFFDAVLDANPVFATLFGIHDRDDRLPDYTQAGAAAADRRLTEIIAAAEECDDARLPSDDRVTLAVVCQQADAERQQLATNAVEYTVTDWYSAPVSGLLSGLARIKIADSAQADGYLARLAKLPDVLSTVSDRHRAGIAAGRLPVRRLVKAAMAQLLRAQASAQEDPLRRPSPTAESGLAAEPFTASRDELLDEVVQPALDRYASMLETEVLPHGRADERPGLCWLPDGAAHYARLVRVHTTTDRTPAQLHQQGLALIESLTEEYARLGQRVFGTGDRAEIFARLRTDPSLRWRDGEELLAAARSAVQRAEQAAPQWFGRVPAQRCRVEPVPAVDAPGAPAAFYLLPALDGSRPGTYFANTYKAEERHRYGAEATAFHEAVPGHHFQRALAQELTELPIVRRLARITAYVEGWGLYCERLADEMGLYTGDLDRFGLLCLDSMRAARLVVDTGLHAHGWTRAQAVEFLLTNSPLAPLEVENEVDRYVATPGQALAYMVGRLEIERIRAGVQQELGARFDIRAFHDVVLGSGPLPLGVLAEVVAGWTAGHR